MTFKVGDKIKIINKHTFCDVVNIGDTGVIKSMSFSIYTIHIKIRDGRTIEQSVMKVFADEFICIIKKEEVKKPKLYGIAKWCKKYY